MVVVVVLEGEATAAEGPVGMLELEGPAAGVVGV